jgi:hypothetical protein
MTHRLSSFSLMVLGLLAIFGNGCFFGDPILGASIRQVDGKCSISFFMCTSPKAPLSVAGVRVLQMEPNRRESPICEIHFIGPASVDLLKGPWTYGDVPRGYASRLCAPLRKGKYRVEPLGTLRGSVIFEMDEAGALHQLSGCYSSGSIGSVR